MQAELDFIASPRPEALTRLVAQSWVPADPDEVFAFYADPANLERLMPPWIKFRISSTQPISMGNGAMIEYRLKIHGIPMKWTSEIRDWNPPHAFVDVQLGGPYRYWHHDHRFEAQDGGTLITDEVDYAPWGGRLVDRLLVRRDLRQAFGYRHDGLASIFPGPSS